MLFFGFEGDEWDEHFFDRDASVLEGVAVVLGIVVEVVWVAEEIVSGTEHITAAYVWAWQSDSLWLVDDKDVFAVATECFSDLVAEVGIGIFVADDPDWVFDAYCAVVCGDDDLVSEFGDTAEEFVGRRMAEPTECEASVGGFVVGEFAHHPALCSGMGEHIDEIEYDDVERGTERAELGDDALAEVALVDLEIGVGVVSAEAVELGLYEVFLVEVFTLVIVFLHPERGVHLLYLEWHQAGEDGIACVLGGGGEDREVLPFVGNGEEIGEEGLDGLPLVVSEIVDDDKKDLFAVVKHGEEDALEDVGGHKRSVLRMGEPVLVVALDKLGESGVSLCALHIQEFAHGGVHVLQVEVPLGEGALDSHPFVEGLRSIDHIGDVSELLAVGLVGMLADDGLPVDMLFETE